MDCLCLATFLNILYLTDLSEMILLCRLVDKQFYRPARENGRVMSLEARMHFFFNPHKKKKKSKARSSKPKRCCIDC